MRQIGTTSLKIAPLVLGANVFGWTIDEATSFSLLDAFLEAGFNCIDTADMYSTWAPGNQGGESETIIGKWFKSRKSRSKIILCTKVGKEMGPQLKGLSKSYILKAVEASLSRLQTDYIDLYFSHEDDPKVPLEETLKAYDQLIQQGKVRFIGASNYPPHRLEKALETAKTKHLPPYQCLQPEYNLYDRFDYERNYEPICRKEHLGVICYFSLASGFLTGKYRSEKDLTKSVRGEGVQKYLNTRGFRILAALDQVAIELGANPTQVSLAWLIAQPTLTAPIASATSLVQLQSLLKAPSLKLTSSQIATLNEASRDA